MVGDRRKDTVIHVPEVEHKVATAPAQLHDYMQRETALPLPGNLFTPPLASGTPEAVRKCGCGPWELWGTAHGLGVLHLAHAATCVEGNTYFELCQPSSSVDTLSATQSLALHLRFAPFCMSCFAKWPCNNSCGGRFAQGRRKQTTIEYKLEQQLRGVNLQGKLM